MALLVNLPVKVLAIVPLTVMLTLELAARVPTEQVRVPGPVSGKVAHDAVVPSASGQVADVTVTPAGIASATTASGTVPGP